MSCGSPVGLTRRSVSIPCSSNRTCGSPCIRLSDKTSHLHPRRASTKLGKSYEPVLLVEVLGQIGSRPPSGFSVLAPKPPTQPHYCVAVDRPICLARGPYRLLNTSCDRFQRQAIAASLAVQCTKAVAIWSLSRRRTPTDCLRSLRYGHRPSIRVHGSERPTSSRDQ